MLTTKNYKYHEINKENILKLISEEDIFRFYIQNFKELGKIFCSEIRKDKHPSCAIFKFPDGFCLYQDFGNGDKIDAFNYVARMYGASYNKALRIINYDFKLNLGLSNKEVKKNCLNYSSKELTKPSSKRSSIQVIRRKWKVTDRLYWGKYYITERELNLFNVYPISAYIINYDKVINLSYNNPGYCIEIDKEVYKILCPYAEKKFKWISNSKKLDFQGYNQLPWVGEMVVITKSMKDVIVLNKFGIPAIAPLSEGLVLDKEFISNLKKRFANIILFYDNDKSGKKGAIKNSEEHNIPMVFIPDIFKEKDISDFLKNFGINKTKELVKELFHGYRDI